MVSFTSANRDEAVFADLEYDGPPEFLRSNFQRGVKRLPVRWSAR